MDASTGSEQAYVNGAELPTTVAAQHLYVVPTSRPLTVTGVVGSLANAFDEGNHGPFGSHSASDESKHWNAYPCTVTASPLAGSGTAAATSSDWGVALEIVASLGGSGTVGTTAVESAGVHFVVSSYETAAKQLYF